MDRVPIAIVANAPAPYRVHLHRRLAKELPGVRLISFFLFGQNFQSWAEESWDDIGAVNLGPGEKLGEGGRSPPALLRDWRKGGAIIDALERQRVPVAVLCGYNYLSLLRVLIWARSAGVSTVIWGDSNARCERARGLQIPIKHLFVRLVMLLCRGVTPAGTAGRDFYVKYGADPDRIRYLPFEPDVPLIEGVQGHEIKSLLDKHRLDQRRRRMVCSGRLSPEKRYDLAIRAFAAIASARPEWDLVLAGDGPLRAELEAMVPPELRARVRFLGFVSDQRELMALYRGSDLLLHPAYQESWGVVIQEAIAAGMALVASDITGAAVDLVRDGVNGHLFPEGDLPALIDKLLDATHPERIVEMRLAAPTVLDQWYEVFDPVKGLREMLQLLGVDEMHLARRPGVGPYGKD